MIPKLIHFVWIGGPMPSWAARNIEQFRQLNPEHQVVLNGAADVLPAYAGRYAESTDLTTKSDLIRYSVLERDGGWYFDVDFWPFRPVADMERAFRLDGSKLFCIEVRAKGTAAWLGNGVLACAPGHPVWQTIRERIVATAYTSRFIYGPCLFSGMATEDPSPFVLGGIPWFCGPQRDWAPKLYRLLVDEPANDAFMRANDPRTGGQVPFAMHLWASVCGPELGPQPVGKHARLAREQPLATLGTGRRVAAVLTQPATPRPGVLTWFDAMAQGLSANGFQVEMLPQEPEALSRCSRVPSVMACWNGMATPGSQVVEHAKRLGIPVLRVEHGFYKRQEHAQVDHEGILHWASWRHGLEHEPPAGAAERFTAVWPDPLVPVAARRGGYVLVIGQVPNDTQMLGSEIQGPLQIQQAVKRALPPGVKAYFRPHPATKDAPINPMHERLPELPRATGDDRFGYGKTKQGAGLPAALAGCRFIVTINSNSIVEALAAGVPCVAFGPHLGIEAGVVKPTTMATLPDDLRAMLDGWCPEQPRVERFLHWLAARQWTRQEIADGAVLKTLLSAAGVTV
jgi:hypothetical protein